MDSLPLGLRDIILLLVACAAVYLVFVLLKLIRVGRRRAAPHKIPAEAVEPSAAAPAVPSFGVPQPPERAFDTLVQEPVFEAPPPAARQALAAYGEVERTHERHAPPAQPTFEWDEVKALFGEPEEEVPAAAAPVAPPPPATPRPGGFGEHIADHLARTDMEMEIQRMRDEMQQMRQELEEMRAARRVSPQYAEAMELSQRGMSAQDVADRLGISLAEAELVQALSRSQQNFD